MAEVPLDAEAYAWWPIIIYMFYLMSVVCDDYLLPAVDAISARFHIPDDVAGVEGCRTYIYKEHIYNILYDIIYTHSLTLMFDM